MLNLFNRFGNAPDDRVLSVFWDKTELKFYVFLVSDATFNQNTQSGNWDKNTALTAATTDSNNFANDFYVFNVLPDFTELNFLDSKAYTTTTSQDRVTFALQCLTPVFPYVRALFDFDTSFCDLQIDNITEGTNTSFKVIATSSKSGIQYSLDNVNFQTSPYFYGLQPDTQYTIYVRDSGGCTDYETTKTLPDALNYGTLYQLNYFDSRNRRTDIFIKKLAYSGATFEFKGQGTPLIINLLGTDKIEDTIKGTSIQINLYSETNYRFLDLFVDNPLKYLVEIRKQNEIIWNGYIEPEIYNEEYLEVPYRLTLTANDGFAYLKDVAFQDSNGTNLRGKRTILDIFVLCFSHLTYDFNFHFAVNTFEQNHDTGICPLAQTLIDCEAFIGLSIYEVVERIVKSFGGQMNWNYDILQPQNNGFHFTEKRQGSTYNVWKYSKSGAYLGQYDYSVLYEVITADKQNDRYIGVNAKLELLAAANSFRNTVHLQPKTALIKGFEVGDFEEVGGVRYIDLNVPTIDQNKLSNNAGVSDIPISFFDASIASGNQILSNLYQVSQKNASYLLPAKLRFWSGDATIYYTKNKKDVGIKFGVEIPEKILSANANFLLAYPKFTDLTTGQKFPHKIKISFDYILETDDEKDNDKDYTFKFGLNVNGLTLFYSVVDDKFIEAPNLFNEVTTKEVNTKKSYNLELSLLPLYAFLNSTPIMQESTLFFRVASLCPKDDLKDTEYYVNSLSIFNLSIEVLPYGTDFLDANIITKQNSNKHWKNKIDFETYFSDIDRNLPNAKYQFFGGLYLADGNTTQKWSNWSDQNKPLQEIITRRFSDYYETAKQKITGTLKADIHFNTIIQDNQNFGKNFIVVSGSVDDKTQYKNFVFIESEGLSCSTTFELIQENCCQRVFVLFQENCPTKEAGGVVIPIVENPNVLFEITAQQNISSFGNSNFVQAGGAGITIFNFALNPNGGLLAFDVAAYFQCDKIEIYHNYTQKVTSSMNSDQTAGLTQFSNVKFSNSDWGNDTEGRNTGNWYIGGAKGNVPSRKALFESQTGEIIADSYGGSEWQRIWWAYSSADYNVNPLAQLVITGENGTAWEATRILPVNEQILGVNTVRFDFQTLSMQGSETLINSGSAFKTLQKNSTITCNVVEKSAKFVNWITDTGGGTFSPSATSETATITADGTFAKITAVFEFRKI